MQSFDSVVDKDEPLTELPLCVTVRVCECMHCLSPAQADILQCSAHGDTNDAWNVLTKKLLHSCISNSWSFKMTATPQNVTRADVHAVLRCSEVLAFIPCVRSKKCQTETHESDFDLPNSHAAMFCYDKNVWSLLQAWRVQSLIASLQLHEGKAAGVR